MKMYKPLMEGVMPGDGNTMVGGKDPFAMKKGNYARTGEPGIGKELLNKNRAMACVTSSMG